jgi:hypothetical protein
MNIFFLDFDVKKCAEYHCDKHVVKMILETAQLLCGAHHMTAHDTAHDTAQDTVQDTVQVTPQVPYKYPPSTLQVPYKLSHKNHPCAIWVRESLSNYLYLCELGLELCKEYTHRYGKRHKSQDVIEWCVTNKVQIWDKGFTPPPKAMPDKYKVEDVVQSYRNYYVGEKSGFANWKNREVPDWFLQKKELDLCYD